MNSEKSIVKSFEKCYARVNTSPHLHFRFVLLCFDGAFHEGERVSHDVAVAGTSGDSVLFIDT